jgi:hypothetical protein
MRTAALILAITLFLAGCDRLEWHRSRYSAVAVGSGSAILIDQATGDTWRLTDAGWVPIRRLPPGTSADDPLGIRATPRPSVSSADIEAELARRNAINQLLSNSVEAKRIATDFKAGALSQETARARLQALLPLNLGSLPPGAESGAWSQLTGK